MPKGPRVREKLTYSNVVSTICLFLLLGGATAVAASQLGKNTVGSKQLKKNAVTTEKLKNQSVTAAKVKNGTLTGTQINVSTLGTVPAAQTAQTAQTAQSANSVEAPEAYHNVTAFLNGWEIPKLSINGFPEPVAFYKDQEGVVHLRGEAQDGTSGSLIFKLPSGYLPASGRFVREPISCSGTGCPDGVGSVTINGPNFKLPADEDGVRAPSEAEIVFLDGVTFRAES
jgi:hypothetical protein